MLCDVFIILPISSFEFKFVVKSNNGVFCFILNLFVSGIDVTPEIFTEYFLIIECIRDQTFHLFFYRTVKIFQRVNNNSFFLPSVSVIQNLLEFGDLLSSPLRLITNFVKIVSEFSQGLW